MDRDQEMYFPGEEIEAQKKEAQPPVEPEASSELPYQENDDDHTYLMKLLDYLQDAVEYGSVVPLTGKRLVDTGMCVDIIKDIRGNLPLAIQYAEQVMRDRDRILSNAERTAQNKISSADARANAALDDADKRAQDMVANAEDRADRIIKDAEIKVTAMIDQNAIKIAAQNEAREIMNNARIEANERKLSASAYAEDMMLSVEKELQRAQDMVRQRRQGLGQDQQQPMQPR